MRIFSPVKVDQKHTMEDFLKNTSKNPFINSVKSKSNFYFKNSDYFEAILDPMKAADKTYNRRHKVKNSYMTIFPNYGLYSEDDMYKSATKGQFVPEVFEMMDPRDQTYNRKLDFVQRYTEEMLKAKNMRATKK